MYAQMLLIQPRESLGRMELDLLPLTWGLGVDSLKQRNSFLNGFGDLPKRKKWVGGFRP